MFESNVPLTKEGQKMENRFGNKQMNSQTNEKIPVELIINPGASVQRIKQR